MAPTTSPSPESLARMVSLGYAKMRTFRSTRLQLLMQYVGRMYGARYADSPFQELSVPLNLIHQAATTMVPNLVFKNPKASICSKFMAFRGYAELLECACNQTIEEINYKHTMRMVVTDAIFSAGFTKRGLTVTPQTLDIDGITHNLGQPYVDRVDPDDMILDATARTWDECKFIGNIWRVPRGQLLEMNILDPDVVNKLSGAYQGGMSNRKASTLSGKDFVVGEAESLLDYVELVDIWIPGSNAIVTLPWTQSGEALGEIIKEVEYEGPEGGPYNMLGFAFAPDNVMPIAPASLWYDLHMLTNKVARKMARQAERNKSVLAYESSSWEDAQEIIDAEDGEAVRVDAIDAIKEVEYGGPTNMSYEYIGWAKENFSELAMNIDMLSGGSSGEPTATQAEILQANTSVRLSDMQGIVYDFVASDMKAIAFYLHTDPLIELPMIKRVNGTDRQVVYTPEMREGDWLDYNIKTKPFSMARQDPNTKLRKIMEFSSNIIPALAQTFQMLGPVFNIEAAIRLVLDQMGLDEGDELINTPLLQMQMAKYQQLINGAAPIDPKVAMYLAGLPMTGSPAQGLNPGQPNPRQMGPNGGTSQKQESNRNRQQRAGEAQKERSYATV